MPSRAQATAISWTGASDNNWFNAANWSPAQIPASADDVVIDTSGAIVAEGTTAVNFNSLALGDLSGNTSPTLTVSAPTSAGSLTVFSNAVFQQASAQTLNFASVIVNPGGFLTHGVNISSRNAVLNLNVSGDFTLQAGATIAVDGLGYAGGNANSSGFGPGGGGNQGASGAGGGHGGNGGNSANNGSGGVGYDSLTNPIDLGSGGGGGPGTCNGGINVTGGTGGGSVVIMAGGVMTISGLISANGLEGGTPGCNYGGGGGGSGGTVNITAVAIAGTGIIRANGGAGGSASNNGGGGGGGRIAINVSGSDNSSLNLLANSGSGGGVNAANGGSGTIAIKNPGETNYSLIIGDLTSISQSSTPISGATLAFSTVALNNSIVTFDPTSTVNINSLIVAGSAKLIANNLVFGSGPVEIKSGAILILNAQSLSGANLVVDSSGTFEQMNTVQLGFASVIVNPSGVLTHAVNISSRNAVLNLNVSGDFILQAGASIAVDGLGYAGGAQVTSGFGPGGGNSSNSYTGNDGGGGGHGGLGGNSYTGAAGGASYDDISNPTDLGSGGGGDANTCSQAVAGGNGGGAVILSVGGTLTVNGSVSANGTTGTGGCGYSGGGGSGGTINITAKTIVGTGMLQASGGAGGFGLAFGGGGGAGGGSGGRIAINVSGANNSNLNISAVSALGSTLGGAIGASGGAGTIAIKNPGETNYSLIIGDLTNVPQSSTPINGTPSFSTITLNNSTVIFDPTITVTVNSIVIAGTVNFTATTLNGGILTVKSGGVFRQMNTQSLDFASVNVDQGGLLTHGVNTSSRSAVLDLNVSGNFNLQAGATIAVDGMGYAGGGNIQSGYGPGGGGDNGSSTGGGGGHGGDGGTSSHGSIGGGTYDDITNPSDLGSGGGGATSTTIGGNGGGAVLISVGGTFSLNGLISADGMVGQGASNYGAGGGAGGTVNLAVTAMIGTGTVQANGGSGAPNNGGGGGGGGRIAINVSGSDNSSLNLLANSGIDGGAGATIGGAGTIALKNPGETNYSLTIGDLTSISQSSTPITGSTLAFSTVTLNNSIVTFDPNSTVNINSLIVAGFAELIANNLASGSVSLTIAGSAELIANNLVFDSGSFEVKSGGILHLNAQSLSGANLVVDSSGTFEQMNAAQLGFTSVVVDPGGVLTHAPNTSLRSSVLDLNVSGDFTLQAGATIAVDGLGYAGGLSACSGPAGNGAGPGGGAGASGPSNTNFAGSGGGHGGLGGTNYANTLGGASYDSLTNPTDLGSGGGGYIACYQPPLGGAGGGAVLLSVGGTLTINGLISADGATPINSYAGGGSGGTVNLAAAALTGSGIVHVNGGMGGGNWGAGGGGGRIAISVGGLDNSNLTLRAAGGIDVGNGTAGGAGTIAIKNPGETNYNLIIGDLTSVPQSSTPITGATLAFSTVTLGNSIVAFDPNSTVNIANLIVSSTANLTANNLVFGPAGMDIESGGTLNLNAQSTSGGSLLIETGAIFVQMNLAPLGFASAMVQSGGLLTHASNSNIQNITLANGNTKISNNLSLRPATLDLNVSGDFTLQSGASIAVDDLGYAGGLSACSSNNGNNQAGLGPGGGGGATGNGNFAGSGGGYGGMGGTASGGIATGASYDSITYPTELGSGGGSGDGGCYPGNITGNPGGAGGGMVLLSVGGTLTIDGLISANGSPTTNSGGAGSGGSVNITAATLAGSGVIRANGGTAGYYPGGGGGGRIALLHEFKTFNGALIAAAGAGNQMGQAGSVVDNGIVIQSAVISSSSPASMAQAVEQIAPAPTSISATLLEQDGSILSAASTGAVTGTFSFSPFVLTRIIGGPFSDSGFITARWTETSGGFPPTQGDFHGVVFRSSTSAPLSVKGAMTGDIRATVDGTLAESNPGSEVFDLLNAGLRFNQFASQGISGNIYLQGSAVYSASQQFSNVSLNILQTSVSGPISGPYSGNLNMTATRVRVNDPSNPHNGQGFADISFQSALGSGATWAYSKTFFNELTRLTGWSDDPLKGLMTGILDESSNPRSFLAWIEGLNVGLPPTGSLVMKVVGPVTGGVSPGQTLSYGITLINPGNQAVNNISVIADYPDRTDFIAASPGYIFYLLGDFVEGNYEPQPFLRWDVSIPPRSVLLLNYEGKVRLTVTAHEMLGGSVYIVSQAEAQKILGPFLSP